MTIIYEVNLFGQFFALNTFSAFEGIFIQAPVDPHASAKFVRKCSKHLSCTPDGWSSLTASFPYAQISMRNGRRETLKHLKPNATLP